MIILAPTFMRLISVRASGREFQTAMFGKSERVWRRRRLLNAVSGRLTSTTHTYGYVQYDVIGNDYLLLKGQTELGPDVKATPIPHMFNLNSLKWRKRTQTSVSDSKLRRLDGMGRATKILWGHSGDSGNGFIGFIRMATMVTEHSARGHRSIRKRFRPAPIITRWRWTPCATSSW